MNYTFLQIKPNNEKYIIESLLENINKYLYSLNNNINDIADDIDDYIIIHKNLNPINYINSFYKDSSENNNNEIYYETNPYDFYDDKYNIIFSDNTLNTTDNINKMSDDERKKQLNLLASYLIKFNNNSSAIFGDVFILSMDKQIYESIFSNNTIESNKIYYSFDKSNLIKSIINIYFIRIYIKNKNKLYYYNREILENYINQSNYDIINDKYIKCSYENNIIFIKYDKPIINSHYFILNNSNPNKYNHYFISLDDNDLNFIISNV